MPHLRREGGPAELVTEDQQKYVVSTGHVGHDQQHLQLGPLDIKHEPVDGGAAERGKQAVQRDTLQPTQNHS